jgi:hypothetical protein
MEEHVASAFGVEEYTKKETSVKQEAGSVQFTFNGLHGIISQKIELLGILPLFQRSSQTFLPSG